MWENMKGLREDKDLSQEDVAKILCVHQTTYSNYELGATNIPNSSLIRLANYYGTSVDYLLDLTDDPTPPPRKKK